MVEVNILGIISIVVFYLAILLVGIIAAWKKKKQAPATLTTEEETNEVILAGRNIGTWVGICTMTATWVGGGYINGTAEVVYSKGLVWAQAPWGYALSMVVGGLFFARKMREAEYVTMLDPLQNQYGNVMGAILYTPAFLGETFYSASILSALGATLSVILNIDMTLAVIVSALVAVGYTMFGGLYSVAYTDVVQLVCIFVGLWLSVPFALTSERVTALPESENLWLGHLDTIKDGQWLDYLLLLIFGGIPWQVYFQRVLSAKSPGRAQALSFVAALGCLILAIPPFLLGAAARSADWNNLPDNSTSRWITNGNITDPRLTIPLVLQYLTPGWVTFIGLGAISAAVMSSADSSVLSASSMFGNNIYKNIFRPTASANEIIWIIRFCILLVGCLATIVGLSVPSIYSLFHLCSDLVFVILFPQLVASLYIPFVNTYGSICAFIVGLFFRVTGGEELIGLKAAIKYPLYDEEKEEQNFPFRTLAMLLSFFTLIIVSLISRYLFKNYIINPRYDYLKVIAREEKRKARQQTDDTDLSERYVRMEVPSQIDRDLRELELGDVVLSNPVG